jgi:NAD+ diphosphatase
MLMKKSQTRIHYTTLSTQGNFLAGMSTQKARPPQPNLPTPAHHDVDSMLSRKFGKEIANYFSGSPLNRVSFLRSDHSFISSAFTHPSTSFLLFNDLSPMAKDPFHLAYASHKEITSLTGENPFEKTEEDMVKEFNSSIMLPLVLFLGLDERRKDGFEYGIYKGIPYFAIDITPKGSIKEKAEGIIEAMKTKGMIFLEGRTAMAMNAPEGWLLNKTVW